MPPPLDPERAHALAFTPTDELLVCGMTFGTPESRTAPTGTSTAPDVGLVVDARWPGHVRALAPPRKRFEKGLVTGLATGR